MPSVARRSLAICRFEGLLPVDIPTGDNVSLNEQRTLDQSGYKNNYSLLCFFLRGK